MMILRNEFGEVYACRAKKTVGCWSGRWSDEERGEALSHIPSSINLWEGFWDVEVIVWGGAGVMMDVNGHPVYEDTQTCTANCVRFD